MRRQVGVLCQSVDVTCTTLKRFHDFKYLAKNKKKIRASISKMLHI